MKKMLISVLALLLAACSALGETFTMSLVGDCTVGDDWRFSGYKSTMTWRIAQEGWDWPFRLAADYFLTDDLTLANCEGVLADGSISTGKEKMALRAPASYAYCFKVGGVDVVNHANNHSADFGPRGQRETFRAMQAQGIGIFADERLYEVTVKGVKIGFVGYTFPIEDYKIKRYKKAIRQLKEDGCTFIVASVHWGKEESYNVSVNQRKYGPMLIDLGADLVFGHGSHTLMPIQYYNGHLIFYSTSNFCFGANASPEDSDTAVFQVTFDIAEDGTMSAAALKVIPYTMQQSGNYQPCPITDEQGMRRVWQKLVFSGRKLPDSGLPESFLTTGYAQLK